MLQNIGPATNVEDLREELSRGTEASVCFLFDHPRAQNWVGVNQTIQIASTMSLGTVTFVAGLIETDTGHKYVQLMINTETGNGTVKISKELDLADQLLIETALAIMHTAAQDIRSAI